MKLIYISFAARCINVIVHTKCKREGFEFDSGLQLKNLETPSSFGGLGIKKDYKRSPLSLLQQIKAHC